MISGIERLANSEGHLSSIYALCTGMVQDSLLSAGGDGLIIQWTQHNEPNGVVIAQTGQRIFCLEYAPRWSWIIAGTMEGHLFFINPQDPDLTRNFKVHRGAVYKLAVLDDALIACGEDGTISLWSLDQPALIKQIHLSNNRLRTICHASKERQIFAGDHQGNLHVLDLPELNNHKLLLARHERALFSLVWDEHSQQLYSGGLDAKLCVSNGFSEPKNGIVAHWFCINSLCLMEGTSYLASASRDKSIRIWDKNGLHLVKEISRPNFAGHQHSVNALHWNPHRSILYSAGDDRIIYHWKIAYQHDPE